MYDLTNTKSSTVLIRFKATLQICDTLRLTSKNSDCCVDINCLCRVLNRGQTNPRIQTVGNKVF